MAVKKGGQMKCFGLSHRSVNELNELSKFYDIKLTAVIEMLLHKEYMNILRDKELLERNGKNV